MTDEAHARSMTALHDGDPETSHEAAASVYAITEVQENIITVLGELVLATDEQIIRHYRTLFGKRGPTDQSIRTRRHELTEGRRGASIFTARIQFSGKFGNSATGRRARLWELRP